jgi:hypothetical protein
MTEARMVAVGMRDHRVLDRAPGIDAEAAGCTEKAGRVEGDEVHTGVTAAITVPAA